MQEKKYWVHPSRLSCSNHFFSSVVDQLGQTRWKWEGPLVWWATRGKKECKSVFILESSVSTIYVYFCYHFFPWVPSERHFSLNSMPVKSFERRKENDASRLFSCRHHRHIIFLLIIQITAENVRWTPGDKIMTIITRQRDKHALCATKKNHTDHLDFPPYFFKMG